MVKKEAGREGKEGREGRREGWREDISKIKRQGRRGDTVIGNISSNHYTMF